MKKLLLASAALVLSGGMAAAQGVTLAGDARMGVIYDGDDFFFSSRARVQFRLDGSTDTGLAFGARFRAHEAEDAVGNTDMSGGEVFISGAFGRLSMGDVDSAAQSVTTNLHQIGYSDLRQGIQYIGSNETAALYEYSFDAFSFALGAGQLNEDRDWSIGVGYEMDAFGVSLAYERSGAAGESQVILGATAGFDPVEVRAFKGIGRGGRGNQYGLSVSAGFDAVTVIGLAKRDINGNNHYGLGAQYSLGGGANIRSGIYRNAAGDTVGDFGIVMSF